MSNAVFPTFRGLTWDVKKRPNFGTIIQTGASGREVRVTKRMNPIWEFELSYSILDDNFIDASGYSELRNLVGFYLQRQGAFDSFLYMDPSDNSVAGQAIGTGDGVATTFQLVRNFGGFAESMQNIQGSPQIFIAGVLQLASAYSVSATGLVTFTSAPASGAAITAGFSYYYRVRFKEDVQEFNEFLNNLWEAQQVKFISVLV